MNDTGSALLAPVDSHERYTALDLLRGFAVFGVLMVNLLDFFRLSLFDHFQNFHSHPGWWNHAIDLIVAELIEFKAINLFSLTFGIGVAIQAERANARGVAVESFLIRRFLILMAFGAVHMTLISNVDILCLYALCGLALIPFLRLPAVVLAIVGLAAIYLPSLLAPLATFPSRGAVLADHAVNATRIYGHGTFGAILPFRWAETKTLILPLLIFTAQRTFGLMSLGVALWKAGIVRDPQRFRLYLWCVCLAGLIIGLTNTTIEVVAQSTGRHVRVPAILDFLGSNIPLAFAYAAALLLWKRSARSDRFLAPFAAMGRMAFTNYLMQSIVFAWLFYGFGLGLFGRLTPVEAGAIGAGVYAGQLWLSTWWLSRHRFGPFEWLWRIASYGRRLLA